MTRVDLESTLFNLVTETHLCPREFYFSGRRFVVQRMVLALDQAILDWPQVRDLEIQFNEHRWPGFKPTFWRSNYEG